MLKRKVLRMKNKYFSYLGMAMRAGKVVSGEDNVYKAVRKGEAKLVCLAEDASDNTAKKFQDKCRFYNVPFIQYGSREQLGHSIGKTERVVMAVTEQGLAQMIKKVKSQPFGGERGYE